MWQTLGYPRIVEALDRALRQSGPAHAYLIVGPAHVGKRRLALDLAKSMNCLGPTPPCDACRSCDRIERGVHPDIQWIGLLEEAGRRRKLVGLAQIQELQHQANLAPFEGRYRVLIVDPAESLSLEAANCLLKTLEEPPERVVLILLATSDAALLPTILSRCQRIDLRPLGVEDVAGALRNRTGLTPERRQQIARLARGRLGWAFEAADSDAFDRTRAAAIAEAAGIVYLSLPDRLQLVSRLAADFSKDRRSVLDRLATWLEWWRDLLLVALGCADLAVNQEREAELARQAAEFGLGTIRRTIQALETAIQQLNENANPRLPIDVLLLHFPVLAPGPVAGAGDVVEPATPVWSDRAPDLDG